MGKSAAVNRTPFCRCRCAGAKRGATGSWSLAASASVPHDVVCSCSSLLCLLDLGGAASFFCTHNRMNSK